MHVLFVPDVTDWFAVRIDGFLQVLRDRACRTPGNSEQRTQRF